MTKLPPLRMAAIVLFSLLFSSGCSESVYVDLGNEISGASVGGSTLALPEYVAQMRSVNMDNLYALVTVPGEESRIVRPNASSYTTYTVERGETLTITVRWFETLDEVSDGGELELFLASETRSQVVTDSVTLLVESADYTTEGPEFDRDGDNFSNLTERLAGSDPTNANSQPQNSPDVSIGSFEANELETAPKIDGIYDSIYASKPAQFYDVRRELLWINNLMIDQGAMREDGNAEFRWFAMHDKQFLYLFIMGENVQNATPFRDSAEAWQDDSVDIFIDGNNSKGTQYDNVDDRHIIIPLVATEGDVSGSNRTYFEKGPNSANIPFFEFATCVCRSGQNTWEVRLPLAQFGISLDTRFGIEIQLNEDNDGGARDAKWGWNHESRVSIDIDRTYQSPFFMGTAILTEREMSAP